MTQSISLPWSVCSVWSACKSKPQLHPHSVPLNVHTPTHTPTHRLPNVMASSTLHVEGLLLSSALNVQRLAAMQTR